MPKTGGTSGQKGLPGPARLSTRTVRRWIERGELPAHRLGRQLRISEKDLKIFLRERWSG